MEEASEIEAMCRVGDRLFPMAYFVVGDFRIRVRFRVDCRWRSALLRGLSFETLS